LNTKDKTYLSKNDRLFK